MRGGELRKVLSFTSRRRECQVGADQCLYEHRWFRRGQLVEAKTTFESGLNIDWDLADARDFKSITCTEYKWDAASFRYMRDGAARPCKSEPPK